MLSDCWYWFLSQKSLSSCYCWHRCCLLTVLVLAQVLAQVWVLVLVLAQVLAQVLVLALALLLGPKLWR
jgi:hypothetical protein